MKKLDFNVFKLKLNVQCFNLRSKQALYLVNDGKDIYCFFLVLFTCTDVNHFRDVFDDGVDQELLLPRLQSWLLFAAGLE